MTKITSEDIILIVGGSGFVGRFITSELIETKAQIVIASRNASDAIDLKTKGEVGQISLVNIDANNPRQLENLIARATYVINLVGILFETKQQKFKELHALLPSRIASICSKNKVKKFIHISALAVDRNRKSKYAKSKLEGENLILKNFSHSTIIRPSVIFGERDSFINLFHNIAKLSPIIPLIGSGDNLLQPVYAGDIAILIKKIIEANRKDTDQMIYEAAGPEKMKMSEIIRLILQTSGKHRTLFKMPLWFAKIKAFFFEFMPRPPFTRDQIELIKVDNIITKDSSNALKTFEIKPTSLQSKIKDIINF